MVLKNKILWGVLGVVVIVCFLQGKAFSLTHPLSGVLIDNASESSLISQTDQAYTASLQQNTQQTQTFSSFNKTTNAEANQLIALNSKKNIQQETFSNSDLPVINKFTTLNTVSSSVAATITSSASSGNWSNPTSWSGGVVPGANDDVVIAAGTTILVDANTTCQSITIESGGILQVANSITLTLTGDWTNSGSFNAGTSGIVEFTGSTSSTISGTTAFEELIISKDNLSIPITITGNVTVSSGGNLTLTGGLIQVNSLASLKLDYSNQLTIPEAAGLEVNGGTLETGNFSITNEGLIRVNSGIASFGTASGNSVHTQVDGAFHVIDGTVNIAGRLENTAGGTLPPNIPSGINISGGTVNLATEGNGLSNTGSLQVSTQGAFNFTGGTIVFQNASTASTAIDMGLSDGTGNGSKTITNGIFQFGNGSTTSLSEFVIDSEIPIPNIEVYDNMDLALASPLTISNELVLGTNTQIYLNVNTLRMKIVPSFGSIDIPLSDDSGNAMPLSVEITSGSYASDASITVSSIEGKPGSNANTSNYLNRYWTLDINGITGLEYRILSDYPQSDVIGTESAITMGVHTGSLPWIKGAINTSTNEISATGLNASSILFSGITAAPPTIVIDNNDPTAICEGSSVNLTTTATGDPTLNYAWTSTPAGFTASTADISVTPNTTINYKVTVTDGNGFTASDAIDVVVNPLPTASISGTTTICQNETSPQITFTGNSGTTPYTFTYNLNGGTDQTITTTSGNTVTLDVPTTITGTLTYTLQSVQDANSCQQTQSGSAVVTVNPLPTASINGTTTVCQNETSPQITFTGNSGTAPYTFTYNLNGGTDQTITTTSGNTVTLDAPTTITGTFTYTLQSVQDANSCQQTQSGSAEIIVHPIPTITASPIDQTICPGNAITEITITNPNNIAGTTYSWTRDNTTTLTGIPSSGTGNTISGTLSSSDPQNPQTTVFTITATANGCSSETFTVEVTVGDNTPPAFTVPGAITLNAGSSCSPNLTPTITGTVISPSDNCTATGNLIINYSDGVSNPGTCPSNYNFTRTWTVSDLAGNSTSKDQIITVEDHSAPVLSIPPTVAIQCDDSILPAATGEATATDNCDTTPSINYTDSIPSNYNNCSYTIYRKWTATDACGNSSFALQQINVSDNISPEVSYQNISIDLTTDVLPDPYLTLTDFLNNGGSYSDNCGSISSFEFVDDHAFGLEDVPGYCPDSIQRYYRIVDECGNFTNFTQTVIITDKGDCSPCINNNSFYVIDLLGDPDAEITINSRRKDKCCDTDLPGNVNCIAFNIRLDNDAVGVEISVNGGTPDVKEWKVDCGIMDADNGIVCIHEGGFHLFTFCKQGSNPSNYTFRSLSGITVESEIETRVSCNTNIEVSGLYNNPSWTSISPGAEGTYNHYLYASGSDIPGSGVNVTNPVFIADADAPSQIQYRICGETGEPSPCTDGLGTDCDIVTIFVKDSIGIDLNIEPDLICEDTPTSITPTISPVGSYTLEWYSGSDASGTLLHTAPSFQPTTEGAYSLVVTDIQNGIPCSSATHNFDVIYDYTGPTYETIPEPLEIVCNDPAAQQEITNWLGSFTATYTDADGQEKPANVTHNFTGIDMICGEVVTVTFIAEDQCDNLSPVQSTITVIDNTNPTFTFCPPATSNFADLNSCETQNLNLDPPTATDDCDTDVSITWKKTGATTGSGAGPVTGPFKVGVTTVNYTATDDCGNTATCIQEVTIIDNQPPELTCPVNVTQVADYGANYASNVTTGDPGVVENCADPTLRWELTPPPDFASEYTAAELSGNDTLPSPGTYYIGVTTITYTLTDQAGNEATCFFTVTVTSAPIIECPENILVDAEAGQCNTTFNPGVPTLIQGGQPITWTYTITNPDGTEGASGSFIGSLSDPGPPDIGEYAFYTGETTIRWTATNNAGSDECTQVITVTDTEPPIITPPDPYEDCVESLFLAQYNGTTNLTYNPMYPDADYHLFEAGNTSLDLDMPNDYDDNCCTAADSYTINWRIDFDGSEPSISGTGQPSEYGSDIPLWGDGVTYQNREHTISYWVVDCHGNTSLEYSTTITITPRPNLIKLNE